MTSCGSSENLNKFLQILYHGIKELSAELKTGHVDEETDKV